MAQDLNVKIGAILDTKKIQSDLSKIKGLKVETKLDLDTKAFNKFKETLEKKKLKLKVQVDVDNQAFLKLKDNIEKKKVAVKVQTKLDNNSFKALLSEIQSKMGSKALKFDVKANESSVKQTGQKVGKTLGDSAGKEMGSSITKTLGASMANETELKKIAKNLSNKVDKEFFKGAKIDFTVNKDANGAIQNIIVQGERADGVMKRLAYSVTEFQNRLKNDKVKVSLISEKDVDKTEKAMAKLQQQVIAFKRELKSSGDKGLLGDLKELEKSNQLTKDSLQSLKNKHVEYERLRTIAKETNDIENKKLGLQQKLNIALKEGRITEEKHAQAMAKINASMEQSNNKKMMNALKNAEQLANREIKARESVLKAHKKEQDEIARTEKALANYEKRVSVLYQKMDRMKITLPEAKFGDEGFRAMESRIAGINLQSKNWQANLQAIERDMNKIVDKSKMLERSQANTKSINDLRMSYQSLVPMLTTATKEQRQFADDLNNRISTAKTRAEIVALQGDLKGFKAELKETMNTLKAGEKIKFGSGLDGAFKSHKKDVESFNKELNQFFKTIHGGNAQVVGATDKLNRYGQEITNIKVRLQDGKKNVQEFTYALNHSSRELNRVGSEITTNASKNLSVLEQFKTSLERIPAWLTGYAAYAGATQGMRALTNEVIALDKAMTDLRRVASGTADVNLLFRESISMASELGNSAHDVLATVSEISRSYDTLTEQQQLTLAKSATIASNVSDLKADDAMRSMIAALNGYNFEVEKSIDLVDKMNEVDNNNSISTQQLSEAMMKGSATASTFGVSIDSLLGHVTAIGATTMESGSQIGK